jgi:hypothetical protein
LSLVLGTLLLVSCNANRKLHVEGIAVNRSGTPVGDGTVAVSVGRVRPGDDPEVLHQKAVITDADGRFAVDIGYEQGFVQVALIGEKPCEWAIELIEATAVDPTRPLRVRLVPDATDCGG